MPSLRVVRPRRSGRARPRRPAVATTSSPSSSGTSVKPSLRGAQALDDDALRRGVDRRRVVPDAGRDHRLPLGPAGQLGEHAAHVLHRGAAELQPGRQSSRKRRPVRASGRSTSSSAASTSPRRAAARRPRSASAAGGTRRRPRRCARAGRPPPSRGCTRSPRARAGRPAGRRADPARLRRRTLLRGHLDHRRALWIGRAQLLERGRRFAAGPRSATGAPRRRRPGASGRSRGLDPRPRRARPASTPTPASRPPRGRRARVRTGGDRPRSGAAARETRPPRRRLRSATGASPRPRAPAACRAPRRAALPRAEQEDRLELGADGAEQP